MEVYYLAATEPPSERESDDTASVSEVDDVVHGSEPGASRFSMLIPTDSYDDVAQFAADSSYADPTTIGGLSHGKIDHLKDCTDPQMPDSNTERTEAASVESDGQNEELKPPEPIFARIETPASLSEEDIERQRLSRLSTAPAVNSQSADDASQISVCI